MTASALVGVTVTYVAGGNGTVSDLVGNLLATDAVGVVTGADSTVEEARKQVYSRLRNIILQNMYYRTDIGYKALEKINR